MRTVTAWMWVLALAVSPAALGQQAEQPAEAAGPEVVEPSATGAADAEALDPEEKQDQELQALRKRVAALEQQLEAQQEALDERDEELEATLEEHAAALEVADQQAIGTLQEQTSQAQQARVEILERALLRLSGMEELLEAGASALEEQLSAAAAELEEAGQLASTWGTPAEAAELLMARQLLDGIPAEVATRNYLQAELLLAAAHTRAGRALGMARAQP